MPLGFAAILAGGLLLVAGVTGSSLASVAKGAPDKTRAAAVPSVTGAPNTTLEQEQPPAVQGGPWRARQATLAHTRGWNLADWNQLISMESGGDPKAVNPSSGAFGIGQFLGGTAREYAPFGALSTDPVRQIEAMAKYISDRYGNPTNALAHEHAAGWY